MLIGCAKEHPETPGTTLPTHARLLLVHQVDASPLAFDTLMYVNAAGNTYGVDHLEYYLSELVLLGSGTTANDTLHGPWYINARESPGAVIADLHPGTYSGATLLLGLPPALNQTGTLPNTLANINMAWPAPMGGGYHFMKFEGHFLSAGSVAGYALHLGTDPFLPHCTIAQSISITEAKGTLEITFNLNEVFRSPHSYNLDSGNYSMGNPALMQQIQANCANAFRLAFHP